MAIQMFFKKSLFLEFFVFYRVYFMENLVLGSRDPVDPNPVTPGLTPCPESPISSLSICL